MTLDERMKIFDALQNEELKILSSKGVDYAGDEDALRNFKINAERLGLSKYQVWEVYAMKHIDAILTSIRRNPNAPTRQAETLYGSILDGRNYLGLLACLLAEDDAKEEGAPHGTRTQDKV
jgi:hypothetical protein